MKFIDAHHHLWDLHALDYVWLKNIGAPKPFGDPTPIQKDYRLEEYLLDVRMADDCELVGSVHVQADGAISDPVAETRWLQTIADKSGLPSAIVGFVNLLDEGAERTLQGHLGSSSFRGVRQIVAFMEGRPELSFAPQNLLVNANWRANYPLLAKYGLTFDLQLYPDQMADAAEFFVDQPSIPVVIDHAGSPWDQSESGLRVWRHGLRYLAEIPHLSIKLSGFGMFDKNWSAERQREIFDDILDIFGAGRVMIGSNFPVDRLMRPYDFVIAQYRHWSECLSGLERRQLFVDNARNFYHLV
jgi:predicted TIM-barrel fold metal-dependent hydrolase